MKEASRSCVSVLPTWDSKVHEAAQSSFRYADHLLNCISGQVQVRSIQEMSLITDDAVTEFRKLISLLDESKLLNCKRIKKGPLPNFTNFNPRNLVDCPNISPETFSSCIPPPSKMVKLNHLQRTPVLMPTNSFKFYSPIQIPALRHCYSESNSTHSSAHSFASSFIMAGNRVDNQIIHESKSKILISGDNYSVLTSERNCGTISEEASTRLLNSTGARGCRYPKRRKLKIKRMIKVPAPSDKVADIPPDNFSWRKYGQKPIKGSSHPRSYYRCSSIRGCPARKHVERCQKDPTLLVVTYQGTHNHLAIALTAPNTIN